MEGKTGGRPQPPYVTACPSSTPEKIHRDSIPMLGRSVDTKKNTLIAICLRIDMEMKREQEVEKAK